MFHLTISRPLNGLLLLSFVKTVFLDLAVAKSLQSTRMVTDADADDDDADVLTTTGYTC